MEIFVLDKEAGLDVGHTAIKIGGKVYGYCPSDDNNNQIYDVSELFGSKGAK
ncbi:hypothetical protein [Pedobacter nyackensis]|uniref:hypothetical protein n=1 Tax=Pedobacter nyackensis TaxID=475255 RepID=UPI00292E0E50|nr:hypothetical protein [Pedobacter nyackensis]